MDLNVMKRKDNFHPQDNEAGEEKRFKETTCLVSENPLEVGVVVERILSFVDNVWEIRRMEGVSKTFQAFCWKSLKELTFETSTRLDHDQRGIVNISGKEVRFAQLAEFLPSVWEKAKFLRGLKLRFFTRFDQDEILEIRTFLELLDSLNTRFPVDLRVLEILGFERENFSAFLPLLVRGWCKSLRELQLQWSFRPNDYGRAICSAVLGCTELRRLVIYKSCFEEEKSYPDSFLRMFSEMRSLRELDFSHFFSNNYSDINYKEFVIDLLRQILLVVLNTERHHFINHVTQTERYVISEWSQRKENQFTLKLNTFIHLEAVTRCNEDLGFLTSVVVPDICGDKVLFRNLFLRLPQLKQFTAAPHSYYANGKLCAELIVEFLKFYSKMGGQERVMTMTNPEHNQLGDAEKGKIREIVEKALNIKGETLQGSAEVEFRKGNARCILKL